MALASGLAAGNAIDTIILRGLIAMVVCYPVGLVVGWLLAWVVGHQEQEGRAAVATTDASPAGIEAGTAPEPAEESAESRDVSREPDNALAAAR